jgi:hypothetical protein
MADENLKKEKPKKEKQQKQQQLAICIDRYDESLDDGLSRLIYLYSNLVRIEFGH